MRPEASMLRFQALTAPAVGLRLAALLVSATVAASLTPGAPANATPPTVGPSIMIIGGTDSYQFSHDDNVLGRGWYSKAAREVRATSLTVSAELNSSITARGNKCRGTTYGERLAFVKKVDILVVEAGDDEDVVCTGKHRLAKLSLDERRRQINRYVKRLATRVDQLKMARSHVFVVTPWGPGSGKSGAQLRAMLKSAATDRAIGFRFIETPRLKTYEVDDGIRPNASGHKATGRRVAKAIGAVAARATSRPRAPQGDGPSMTVLGDSITSWFSFEASRSQGWFAVLAKKISASTVTTAAEGGSGINVRGNRCRGTTFGERLRHVTRTDLLVIEVGRNDYKQCSAEGRTILAPPSVQEAGIDAFMVKLQARLDQLGMLPDQVYFVTPWGSRYRPEGEQIRGFIRSAAERSGFHYVETPFLRDNQTIDGTHPNLAGHRLIADHLQRAVTAVG